MKSIATTAFQDGGLPILEGECGMHRQASFYANQWPEGTEVAEDGDVFAFYLPPTTTSNGKPVLGGGEFVAAFADRPEVQAVQTYLSSDVWANEKAKATLGGGWVSANKGLDVANLASPIDKLSVEILQDPEAVFRFDGSDLMPAAVGAGSFWKEMTDWITGERHQGRPRQHRGVLAHVVTVTRRGRAAGGPARLTRSSPAPSGPEPTRRR